MTSANPSIGIDSRIASPNGAGKHRYSFEIIRALAKAAPHLNFKLFTKNVQPEFSDLKNLEQICIPGKSLLWQLKLKKYLKKHPVDLFIAPSSYLYPALAPKTQKTMLVVHDLISFLSPKDHAFFPKWVERLTLKPALKKTSAVICVSKNTKTDLIKRFPLVSGKPVWVATPAAGPEFKPVEEKHLKLPEPYVLALGSLNPRKNLSATLRAFERVSGANPELQLCVVGGKAWKSKKIIEGVPESIKKRVHFMGHVPAAHLPEIYSRAEMLVFPSFYEGFGMPPLEAMACSCPVIVSNAASLPEVVGTAGIMSFANDIETLAKSMESLLQKKNQILYAERGQKRAQKFSWESSANELLKGIHHVLKIVSF